MSENQRTGSYPFMHLADDYGLNYGDVLIYAYTLRTGQRVAQAREAQKRMAAAFTPERRLKPFLDQINAAVRDLPIGLSRSWPADTQLAEDRITAALDRAEQTFSYSADLTQLIDRVATFELRIGDEVLTFTDNDHATAAQQYQDHLARARARHRAQAVLAAVYVPRTTPTLQALEAFLAAGGANPRQGITRFSAWSLDKLATAFDLAVAALATRNDTHD